MLVSNTIALSKNKKYYFRSSIQFFYLKNMFPNQTSIHSIILFMENKKPRLLEFPRIGNTSIGYLSVAEQQQNIPFEIKRIFWTYFTPESIVRGRHAHHGTEMVLIALSGRIIVTTEMPGGELETFKLEQPDIGLYMPPYCWHTMQYTHTSVQLVITSSHYTSEDYIRSYEEFQKLPPAQ
jgi:mannose-6-phosphate isomerase-like protein (cupin superfamily)